MSGRPRHSTRQASRCPNSAIILARALSAILFLGLSALPAAANGARFAEEGEMCGGIAGLRCEAGLWCDPRPGQCGAMEAVGVCIQPSPICTREYRPVCGCDGKTYGNDCERRAARIALDYEGACDDTAENG